MTAPAVSPLLDLVRQWGTARYLEGYAGHTSPEYRATSEALSDRIAALVAQQPVQARRDDGLRLWQHVCCSITAFVEPPQSAIECTFCPQLDGPWRPLLVGGDPAPESDPLRCPTCDSPQSSMHPAVGGGGEVTALCADRFHAVPGRPDRCLCGYVEAGQAGNCVCGFTDPNDIQGWRNRYAEPKPDKFERLRALRSARDEALRQRDIAGGLVDELLHITGVDKAAHLAAAVQNLVTAFEAAQSGPLVLSLPTVPGGASLVGEATGQRYSPVRVPNIVMACWQSDLSDGPMDLGSVLDREGRVWVEMAPPREQRTWPKLDGAPLDLRWFEGASGLRYRRHEIAELDRWRPEGEGDGHEDWRPLAHWQQVDGPLTEVSGEVTTS